MLGRNSINGAPPTAAAGSLMPTPPKMTVAPPGSQATGGMGPGPGGSLMHRMSLSGTNTSPVLYRASFDGSESSQAPGGRLLLNPLGAARHRGSLDGGISATSLASFESFVGGLVSFSVTVNMGAEYYDLSYPFHFFPYPSLLVQFDPLADQPLSGGTEQYPSYHPASSGVISRKSLLIKLPCVLDGVSGGALLL